MMHTQAAVAERGALPFKWFVAAVNPCHELIAERHLTAAGIETFSPVSHRTLPPKGMRRKPLVMAEPLFRGYLFVLLPSPVPQAAWNAVNTTRGVARLLASASGPLAVHSGLVEALREAGPVSIVDPKARATFRRGQQARVTAGALTSIVATILSVEPRQRVKLLLKMLGSEREVVLPVSVLERA